MESVSHFLQLRLKASHFLQALFTTELVPCVVSLETSMATSALPSWKLPVRETARTADFSHKSIIRMLLISPKQIIR